MRIMSSFRLWWQDYTGWRSARAEDAPPPKWQNFRTMEAAGSAQAELKAKSGPELVSCITRFDHGESRKERRSRS